MMYKASLAVAVKNNGKVLREFNKDTVFLPFGSEYSVLIKNLNTIRALVHITIDGQNMTKDGLVVNAGSEVELERKITENMNKGNKFKFIERNDAVEQHRGVKLEDGVIRIEYQFEKMYVPQKLYYVAPNYWNYPYGGTGTYVGDILVAGSTTSAGGVSTSATGSALRSAAINAVGTNTVSYNAAESPNFGDFVEQGFNDAGITVPGSQSDQKFNTVWSFPLEDEKHVMIFKLLGETPDNEPIRKPVTVKSKPRCQTCNKQNKAHAKFCSHCGTSLQVIT